MKISRPPGPRDHVFGMSLLRAMQRDFLGFWKEAHQRYGDAIYMRHMNFDHYAFMHPEQIREVLVEQADCFIRYERHMEVLSQLQGQSLLTTEGEVWQKQRRTLLPGFSPKRFPHYAQQMTAAVGEMLATIPADGETPVDFEHAMDLLAMDVILRTMFGSRVADDAVAVEHAVRALSRIAYEEMFLPFALPDWLPLRRNAEKRDGLRLLDNLIWSHIRARREAAEPGEDLLGMLLSAADKEDGGAMLSDVEVRDQLMSIFMAGHETTAAGVTWAGWKLATHPELAAKAANEVDQVLGDDLPEFADLARLPFLAAFIKETMRVHPPAPGVFQRRAAKDVQIGQWTVPKGSLVTIVSVIPQLDARWFTEPERFDPSRFEGDAARAIARGAYFPFGAGPRVCIGSSFATMEMTLILAMLLQRFTLMPAPGQGTPRAQVEVIVRPQGGMRLLLNKRQTKTPQPASGHADTDRAGACPFQNG